MKKQNLILGFLAALFVTALAVLLPDLFFVWGAALAVSACKPCNKILNSERGVLTDLSLAYSGRMNADNWWREITVERTTDNPDGDCLVYVGGTPCFVKRHCGTDDAYQPTLYDYMVKTCRFSLFEEWEEKYWKYDKTGLIRQAAARIGNKARLFPQKTVCKVLNRGELEVGPIDGQPIFSFNHCWNEESQVQSNLLISEVADPQNPTCEEFRCCVFDAINQILSFRDDQGELIRDASDFSHFIVVHGLTLNKAAQQCFLPIAACGPTSGQGANVLLDGDYVIRRQLKADFMTGYASAPPPTGAPAGTPGTVGTTPTGNAIIVIGVPHSVNGMSMGGLLGCTTLEDFMPKVHTPESSAWNPTKDCKVIIGATFYKSWYGRDWTLAAQCNMVAAG